MYFGRNLFCVYNRDSGTCIKKLHSCIQHIETHNIKYVQQLQIAITT